MAHLAAFSASGIYLADAFVSLLFSVIFKYNNCKMKRKRHGVFFFFFFGPRLGLGLVAANVFFINTHIHISPSIFFQLCGGQFNFRWANLANAGPALNKKKKKE